MKRGCKSGSYTREGSINTLSQGNHYHLFLLLKFLQDTLHCLQNKANKPIIIFEIV